MYIKSKQAAKMLEITYWWLVSMLRSEKLPQPKKDASGDLIWTARDIRNARRALSMDFRRKEARREER